MGICFACVPCAQRPASPGALQVRRVCAAYCRTLCWNLAYYLRGSAPVPPPGAEPAAVADGGGITPYASWQVHYEVRERVCVVYGYPCAAGGGVQGVGGSELS